jgi:hypothetical protein
MIMRRVSKNYLSSFQAPVNSNQCETNKEKIALLSSQSGQINGGVLYGTCTSATVLVLHNMNFCVARYAQGAPRASLCNLVRGKAPKTPILCGKIALTDDFCRKRGVTFCHPRLHVLSPQVTRFVTSFKRKIQATGLKIQRGCTFCHRGLQVLSPKVTRFVTSTNLALEYLNTSAKPIFSSFFVLCLDIVCHI